MDYAKLRNQEAEASGRSLLCWPPGVPGTTAAAQPAARGTGRATAAARRPESQHRAPRRDGVPVAPTATGTLSAPPAAAQQRTSRGTGRASGPAAAAECGHCVLPPPLRTVGPPHSSWHKVASVWVPPARELCRVLVFLRRVPQVWQPEPRGTFTRPPLQCWSWLRVQQRSELLHHSGCTQPVDRRIKSLRRVPQVRKHQREVQTLQTPGAPRTAARLPLQQHGVLLHDLWLFSAGELCGVLDRIRVLQGLHEKEPEVQDLQGDQERLQRRLWMPQQQPQVLATSGCSSPWTAQGTGQPWRLLGEDDSDRGDLREDGEVLQSTKNERCRTYKVTKNAAHNGAGCPTAITTGSAPPLGAPSQWCVGAWGATGRATSPEVPQEVQVLQAHGAAHGGSGCP